MSIFTTVTPALWYEVREISQQPVREAVYRTLVHVLGSKGIPFLKAYSVAKSFIPELDYKKFGDMYEKPVKRYLQHQYRERGFSYAEIPAKYKIKEEFTEPIKYRHVLKYDILDDDGNVLQTKYMSLYTDDDMTDEGIIEKAQEMYAEYKPETYYRTAHYNVELTAENIR